jgi:hypothetical protein
VYLVVGEIRVLYLYTIHEEVSECAAPSFSERVGVVNLPTPTHLYRSGFSFRSRIQNTRTYRRHLYTLFLVPLS